LSATERHSHEGTEFSSTFFRRAGTPALRKYFCARMSTPPGSNGRNLDVLQLKDDRSVRIANLAGGLAELDKDALNRKMSGFDWALNIPAAPPPQRVSYKQRLV
jgi:hypothetical protein